MEGLVPPIAYLISELALLDQGARMFDLLLSRKVETFCCTKKDSCNP